MQNLRRCLRGHSWRQKPKGVAQAAAALFRMQVSLNLGGFSSDTASVYPLLRYHRPLRNLNFQWASEHLGQADNSVLGGYEVYAYKMVG